MTARGDAAKHNPPTHKQDKDQVYFAFQLQLCKAMMEELRQPTKANRIRIAELPTRRDFREWRHSFMLEVVAASNLGVESFHWIMEVEHADKKMEHFVKPAAEFEDRGFKLASALIAAGTANDIGAKLFHRLDWAAKHQNVLWGQQKCG